MEKEKLLIYGHYYYPDVASTGQLLKDLAEGLIKDYDVTVICTVPSYTGEIRAEYKTERVYRQEINGVNLIRIRVPEYKKSDKKSRLHNISSYFLGAILESIKIPKQDYIFAVSQPPILGGVLGVIGKWLKKGKYVYIIQDFNPEQIEAVSYTKSDFLLKLALKLDTFSCRVADRVVVVGRDMLKTLNNRFKENKSPAATFINNWMDEEEIYPLSRTHDKVDQFKKKYNLEGKYIIEYSGNLGLYYDLENILKVVEQFKEYDEIVFLFIGEGSIKETLVQYKEEHKLNNVRFVPYQDKQDLIYSLNAGDVHWVVNAKGIKGISVPSKLYGIMAAGKPVIGVLEEGSEARLLIEESGCGLVTDPGDYASIRKLIENSYLNKKEMQEAGLKGREYLENTLTKAHSINKYLEVIKQLREERLHVKKRVLRDEKS